MGTLNFPTVEAFYTADERRRRSPELDYGVWWRRRGVVYRLTWVEATGELIAVQLTPARAMPLSRLADQLEQVHVPREYAEPVAGIFGVAVFGGEPETVTVIGTVRGRDVVERLLEGWAETCGEPESLAWVLERVNRDEAPA
jgi:hypothetical protein